jgi:hypothetical protein
MIKHKVSKRGIHSKMIKDVVVGKLVHSLWRKACKYDGIPPSNGFAVFSDTNPYAKAHNRVVQLWFGIGYKRVKLP